MKDNKAISLYNISKKYVLHHEKPTFIEGIFKGRKSEVFWPLRNVSFDIKKGERVGIIGHNGSGKSTLMKIIAGITSQTTGKISVQGRVAALIDLGAGFHPELTGEENILLNGMLLGMSKEEIASKREEIITFSGLKKFIDAPFYTYSSGMELRLGFSIAVFSHPDILLIDEVLAVGDEGFQKKSYRFMQKLIDNGKTIVYISHNLDQVAALCEKVIWLHKGRVKAIGASKKTINEYVTQVVKTRV